MLIYKALLLKAALMLLVTACTADPLRIVNNTEISVTTSEIALPTPPSTKVTAGFTVLQPDLNNTISNDKVGKPSSSSSSVSASISGNFPEVSGKGVGSAKFCGFGFQNCDNGKRRVRSSKTRPSKKNSDLPIPVLMVTQDKPFAPVGSYRSPNIPQSPTQGGVVHPRNPNQQQQAPPCVCVPINQCNSFDILQGPSGGGNYPQQQYGPSGNGNGYNPSGGNYGGSNNYYHPPPPNQQNFNGGSGPPNNLYPNNDGGFITGNRPSYGQVGQGIDPRKKVESSTEDRNATVVEAGSRHLPDTAEPPSPAPKSGRPSRETYRIVNEERNSGPYGCYDRDVCCRNPIRPQDRNPSHFPPQVGGSGMCGKRNNYGNNGRILASGNGQSNFGVGNGETDFGEYPWQVAILRREGNEAIFVCGGTLIDSRHVLTAAHCIQSQRSQALRVRLGDWDVGSDTEYYPFQEVDVASTILHPDYNQVTLFNDIAIVKLGGFVDHRQSPHISPICLPEKHFVSGTRCLTTGWGKDAWGHDGKFQHRLQEVDLPILNHYDCEQKLKRTKLGNNFVLHPGFICAGGEANKDSCKGDGGGPLACEIGGNWQLAGIVSWGVGCGQADVPGVYVKVSNYHDWIRQNIGY